MTENRRKLLFLGATALCAALAAAGAAALLVNISQRKAEAQSPFYRVVALDDQTDDPAVWGKNFPQQYDGYRRTVEMRPTRFAGSEAMHRVATTDDPRTVVARSKLDADPRLKVMWAGYSFARDYRERRGHAYMLDDQMFTERQLATHQPGACINCHASTYVAMKQLGDGDLARGFARLNALPYAEARKLVTHPVSCLDCHDPTTLQLRVTRPAFIRGIRALKASQGVADYDVNAMATRQEMRSYVCAQCHVEYYFKGDDKQLTFPWDKGNNADQILGYYEEIGFKDWVHATTGTMALKAQHPEFETWSQGVHARAGVACADCHMPYMRAGAMKVSDHHVRSPLLNINRACQTCHHWPEAELRGRVEEIQARNAFLRNLAMDALVALITDIEGARAAGAGDPALAPARDAQRRAQFLIDFVSAENSEGFHAPQESARLLAEAIDHCRRGQASLRGLTVVASPPASLPASAPATAPASAPAR
jgi:nitrite reductase (cytochrome c-552)